MGFSNKYVRSAVVHYIANEIRPNSVLDLGMGYGAYGGTLKALKPRVRMIGLDAWWAYLNEGSGEARPAYQVYDILIKAKIEDWIEGILMIQAGLTLCMDVVEHFVKHKAVDLLDTMESAIISTPLFFYPQGVANGNPYEEHLCWFCEDEIVERGYELLGQVPDKQGGDIGVFTKGTVHEPDRFHYWLGQVRDALDSQNAPKAP